MLFCRLGIRLCLLWYFVINFSTLIYSIYDQFHIWNFIIDKPIFSKTFLKYKKKSSGDIILVNIHSNEIVYLKRWIYFFSNMINNYWESILDGLFSGVVESIEKSQMNSWLIFFFFWNSSHAYIWRREWLIPLGIHSTSNQIRKPGSCDLLL